MPHFQCTRDSHVLASSDYVQSIAEAARTLYKPRSLDDTLQTIVEVACNSVPGFDHVDIATLERKGDIETRAFIGDLVLPLDKTRSQLAVRLYVDEGAMGGINSLWHENSSTRPTLGSGGKRTGPNPSSSVGALRGLRPPGPAAIRINNPA